MLTAVGDLWGGGVLIMMHSHPTSHEALNIPLKEKKASKYSWIGR